jgi:putative transposase
MAYDPERHHRPFDPAQGKRSIRLKGYDYAQPGVYFVTICVREQTCALGDVVNGEMVLSDAGHVVRVCWDDLPNHYPHVQLDAFIIMPNHVHGVIVLVDDDTVVGAGFKPAPTTKPAPAPKPAIKRHGLPEIVRAFKSFSARRINEMHDTAGAPFWQRGFYEHIVRNERELDAIRRYILDNPLKWALDRDNPEAVLNGG